MQWKPYARILVTIPRYIKKKKKKKRAEDRGETYWDRWNALFY